MPKRETRRAKARANPNKVRTPLNREQVLRAAIAIADRDGIEAVTMRRLGQQLGVEAMSLYHHVASKDDVLDGVVDLLLSEIETPQTRTNWRAAIRERAMTARAHIRRHPWVAGLITSRRGLRPAMLRYLDWVVGELRQNGFSGELIHSAVHLVGARLFGFNEETFSEGITPADAQPLLALMRTGEYPAIAQAMKGMHHDDDHEFAFGLDLILDGLERARDAATAPVARRRVSAVR